MDVAPEVVARLPSVLSTSCITPNRVQPIPTHLFSKKKSQALGTSRCPSRQNSLRVSPGGVPLPCAGHPWPPPAARAPRLTRSCAWPWRHTPSPASGPRLPRRLLRWVRVLPSFQPPKARRPSAQPSEAMRVLPAPPAQAASAATVRTPLGRDALPSRPAAAGRGVPGNADSAAGWQCPPSAPGPCPQSRRSVDSRALASPRSETCFGSTCSEAVTRCINIGQSWAF